MLELRAFLIFGAIAFVVAATVIVALNVGEVWAAVVHGDGPVWWAWWTFLVADVLVKLEERVARKR